MKRFRRQENLFHVNAFLAGTWQPSVRPIWLSRLVRECKTRFALEVTVRRGRLSNSNAYAPLELGPHRLGKLEQVDPMVAKAGRIRDLGGIKRGGLPQPSWDWAEPSDRRNCLSRPPC